MLRRTLLGRRRALSVQALTDSGRALAAAVVAQVTPGGVVAAYVSLGTEPPTGPLLSALTGAGARVLLPVLGEDGDLDWAAWEGRLEAGRRGTQQPPGLRLGRDAVTRCDLVVVPAVAVDVRGVRLGRGGGAYDRALRRATGTTVALLHDGELVDRLPEEPHDVRVSAAATPADGVVHLRGRMSP
jgi:5-formyltetrahydrofolate cyclo-ligase